jgi:hypothetical protein
MTEILCPITNCKNRKNDGTCKLENVSFSYLGMTDQFKTERPILACDYYEDNKLEINENCIIDLEEKCNNHDVFNHRLCEVCPKYLEYQKAKNRANQNVKDFNPEMVPFHEDMIR